jgi:hypothetical protein
MPPVLPVPSDEEDIDKTMSDFYEDDDPNVSDVFQIEGEAEEDKEREEDDDEFDESTPGTFALYGPIS